MKLTLKRTGKTFDVHREIGELLLEITDQLERYVEPPPPPRVPNSRWWITRTVFTQRPMIAARCSTCGNTEQREGPTAHETIVFSHCGVNEKPPADIVKTYAEESRKYWRIETGARTPTWLKNLEAEATRRGINNSQ